MASDSPASLILPAYVPNEELLDVTRRCLDSLEATAESYQLVIVDNGSMTDAAAMLFDAADRYVCYDQPLGYARAANIGLAIAEHDWLVVLNTDVEFLRPGWLEQFQNDYLSTPGGILSAMDSPAEAKIHMDESWFSCWITQRKIIQEVGYFDESMGYRFHDQDYAIRVKRAGYEVMRDGCVQVKHIDSATYDVMGRDDSLERQLMLRRWNAVDFNQWMNRGSPAPEPLVPA